MNLSSIFLAQGHATSFWPFLSGAPTEWMQGMNEPSLPRCFITASPVRVMMFMFTTTYGESVISMPYWVIGLPIGPIANGITYIVRPFMQPL